MLTIDDCLNTCTLESSACHLINKVAFDYRKGYTTSHDGQTYWDFAGHFANNFDKIKRAINSRRFSFQPCLKVVRRVKLNKVRDIYISTWRDKFVERWMNDCLNRLLNDWFSPNSYAYRLEDLGVDSCQRKVARLVKPDSFIAKRDITAYFYSINHDLLFKKLDELVDKDDYLYELIRQRIEFDYIEKDGDDSIKKATIGIPFGSSFACTLANINLTDLDKEIDKLPVSYFRYADDFLIISRSPDDTLNAANKLDEHIKSMGLLTKPSHSIDMSFIEHPNFEKITKFKHLGIEFMADGSVKLSVEKQRKVVNFFKRAIDRNKSKIKKTKKLDSKLKIAVGVINEVMTDRIRSIAIIDYYLKHINDENQLKNIDRIIAELVISTVLEKKFRKRDFRTVPFKKLRDMGLISLRHRMRLHKHGYLKVDFMSLHNEMIASRYINMMKRRQERINHMKLSKKIARQS